MVKRALVFGLVACTTHNPAFCPDGVDSTGQCIAADASIDAPPGCFGAGGYVVCPTTLPTSDKTVTHVDTTNDCDEMLPLGCLVEGTNVTIAQALVVRGGVPLVLLATDTLTITATGVLDATDGGAGADTACTSDGIGAGSAGGNGGGGAGGSFASAGAVGGAGGGGAKAGTPASAVTPLPKLAGGCRGGDGADGAAGTHGAGGGGGGAIYVVAGMQLSIAGTIDASGGGGHAGLTKKGGAGGGGAGGMIVVFAPQVAAESTALLLANGGGGGGGGGNNLSGMTGTTPVDTSMPAGGTGGDATNAGGHGAFDGGGATAGGPSGDGGGGGGGGVGVIYVLGASLGSAQVSPPPS